MTRHKLILPACSWLVMACAGPATTSAGGARSPAASNGDPTATYFVYVGAESADLIHRIRFGPDGASVDQTTPVGELAVETEGPHGLARSPNGRHIYMTTGHGIPDGKLWKIAAGSDTLAAAPILLGRFPATLDITPDGLYAFVANFNLHGEPVPSTISVIFTPDMIEVEQVETCTKPHGARMNPLGTHLYTNCIMDDQLVELDTRTFEVSRRFYLAKGKEGPLPADHRVDRATRPAATCSPTWAEPTPDGSKVYVACNGGDVIHEIDLESWSILRTWPTGRGIYNLDITPDCRVLVGSLKQGAGVEFFDTDTGESLARLKSTTTVTHGVAISPDSRYAFISVEGVGAEPGKVDIYDLRTFQEVASVEVGQQAGGIIFWRMDGG